MAEPEPRDDPEYMKNFPNGFLDFDVSDTCFEEDRDFNLEEEPTKINPEICVDVFARKPQVKDSASCSAIINEATKKTYASSSRNREDSSESGEIRRVDNKEDDRNDGDVRKESDPQQQLTRTNPGSTSSTSDRNNTRQLIGMQSQRTFSQCCTIQQPQNNTYQQLPVINPMAILVPTQFVMPTPTHIYIPLQMQYPMTTITYINIQWLASRTFINFQWLTRFEGLH
ncbi:uncharacterized protein LOC9308873 [Arabidopsis lyrata subsp. lyrata]|uniref:uncharacterized protein LOC9308873 n=1 Tax=Arabidopsis lyrata subsp. lyrata TaxID=81972 RepID=UPI000A29D4A8|nr:uncharacterized protein LOC9308873 [Arabidopsis lyrata subsp. lyrata]|eukprot:XP_020876467.1 uncharacterized protein LOC9308873 [Arabidopsis lyrata subsp. lyrata]